MHKTPSTLSAQEEAEALFAERLPLTDPMTVDMEDPVVRTERKHDALNSRVADVFAATRQKLPRLFAQVRTGLLKQTPKVFVQGAAMSVNGYLAMERPRKIEGHNSSHRIKVTKVLEFWRQNNVAAGIREQCLELLTAGSDLDAFYQRIGFDIGHARVEEQFPHFYNRQWQRKKIGTVPDAREVFAFVNAFYWPKSPQDHIGQLRYGARAEQGSNAWLQAKERQLTERGIEEPLLRLRIGAEFTLGRDYGHTLTVKSLVDEFGLSPIVAERLLRCEMMEWHDELERLSEDVLDEWHQLGLHEAWERAWSAEVHREKFHQTFFHHMNQQKIGTGELATYIDVRSPEARNRNHPTNRRYKYRSDNEVRHALTGRSFSHQVAIDPLIAIVTDGNPSLRDELTELYASDRERALRRNGSGLHGKGLEMRILRERAGIHTMRSLAKLLAPTEGKRELRQLDRMLQRLERQESCADCPYDYDEVYRTLQEIAAERTKVALQKFARRDDVPEERRDFSTVQGMGANLIAAKRGGAGAIATIMEDRREEGLWLRRDQITQMGEGKFVPALPNLRWMHEAVLQEELPDEVRQDWYSGYPQYLVQRDFAPVKHPLGRVISTVIHELEPNHTQFFHGRYGGHKPYKRSQEYYQLVRHAQLPDEAFVHSVLASAGIEEEDVRMQLALGLLKTRVDARNVVQKLLPQARSQKLPADARTFLGMLPSELPHSSRARSSP